MDLVRLGDGADFIGDVVAEYFFVVVGGFNAAGDGDECAKPLTFDFVGESDDGGFDNHFV